MLNHGRPQKTRYKRKRSRFCDHNHTQLDACIYGRESGAGSSGAVKGNYELLWCIARSVCADAEPFTYVAGLHKGRDFVKTYAELQDSQLEKDEADLIGVVP